ncbi:hypothetical protein CCP2SC5_130004 [Azospirillaceae bacterium]
MRVGLFLKSVSSGIMSAEGIGTARRARFFCRERKLRKKFQGADGTPQDCVFRRRAAKRRLMMGAWGVATKTEKTKKIKTMKISAAAMAAVVGLCVGGWSLVARAEGAWIPDPKSGCKVWSSFPEPGESVSWDGPCEEGVAHGKGTLLWLKDGQPNGSYIGDRRRGKAQGHGINIWMSGDRYEGEWKDDAPEGFGIYVWGDGSRYEGEWRNGVKSGKAINVWANGDRFEGVYESDKPTSGVYIRRDGARFVADVSGSAIGAGARILTTEEKQAVRRVGQKVCRQADAFFGYMSTTIIGFVENASGNRIQIRVAETGLPTSSYQGIGLGQNTIIWDDPENWEPC